MTTNRVANTLSPRELVFEDRPQPHPGPGTALVRIEYVTLCGTDLHIWEGEYLNPFPIVQGHEAVGVVERIAPGADGVHEGERVVISPVRSCGKCHACSIGRANVCADVSVLGCYENGTLAQFVLAPIAALRPVPEDVPTELAPLSEPASIALQAVGRGRPETGELAVVFGCGPIGLIAILALRRQGVDVVAIDTIEERARFATQFGAAGSVALTAGTGLPSAGELAELAGSDPARPITLVIEATGSPAALSSAVDIAAPTGRVVVVGISDRDVTLPVKSIPYKELDILGSRNSLDLIGEGLELISANRSAFEKLITHRFAFEDSAAALQCMREDAATVRKVLITVNGNG